MCITESLSCSAEIGTILYINYTPIKKKLRQIIELPLFPQQKLVKYLSIHAPSHEFLPTTGTEGI